MKCTFLTLFVLTVSIYSTRLKAQDFSTIVSKDGILAPSIQALTLQDSLFVFYSTAGKKNFNSVAILPDGSQKPLDLEELDNKSLAALRSSSDHVHFDFFDPTKDGIRIKSLSVNKGTLQKTIAEPISLSSRVIGYESSNDSLTVLTFNSKTSIIQLQKFKNLRLVFTNEYPVNAQLFKEKATFIPQRGVVPPSDADADVKLFLDKKYLWIIAENHERNPISTCTVFRIDIVTGQAITKGIIDHSANKWNTMICGDHILKVIKSNGITLEVHAFDKSDPIFSISFQEGSQISKEHAYERRGASNEVFPVDVQQALKAWGRPIVIPISMGPDSILLKIGNFEPQLIPKASSLAYFGLVFELARIPSYLFNQKVSVDRYFYIKGNFSQGFNYERSPAIVDNVIDDFEVTDRKKPNPIKFKGYVISQQAAFGIYKFEEHYDELKIKKFSLR